jgi:hypothetical protein
MGWVRVLVPPALSFVLLAACSPGVPEGFTEAEVEGVIRFAYPEGWRTPARAGWIEGAEYQVEAPSDGGAPMGVLVFLGEAAPDADLRTGLGAIKADIRLRLTDVEFTDERGVEVRGAEEALLLEFTYRADTGELMHSRDVFAKDGEGNEALLRVAGPEDRVSPDLAMRIISTLEFTT